MSSALKERIEAELVGKLNDVQREAVLHDDGPLLIVAGAGSGKTRVITHRIAYLARIRDVFPWKIAAVTFTNKAAGEMRERLETLMGPMAQNVFVRTFHSLGLYVLSRHGDRIGLKSGFTIADQQGQTSLLKRILKERGIDPKQLAVQSVSAEINRARDAYISPERYREQHANDFYGSIIGDVFVEYVKRLRESNAVDFGDLQYETVRIFQEHPDVLDEYRALWRHFMIDEYQDTNHVQYLLGRLIAAEHRNIMVVGDDDQSIYSWRGADISNILSFEQDYPEAKILRLEENYRSTPLILRAAASLIQNNEERREKTLFSSKGDEGDLVKYSVYDDDTEEARSIVSRIRSMKSQGYKLNDMAVFYRTNAQSRIFEKILRENDIDYVLVGALRFYERKEIKDLLAYLNVVVNRADDLSLERIINMPARGVGDTGLERLRNVARAEGLPLMDALPRAGEIPNFRAAKKMEHLHDLFAGWRALNENGELPSIIATRILEETGYLAMLENDPNPDAPGRLENLEEFIASLEQYEEEFDERELSAYDPGVDPDHFDPDTAKQQGPARPNLADYIQRISLYTSDTESGVGNPESETAFVYLMTLHNAKGLEFSVVYLSGLEEGYLPHSLSLDEGNIEEERRLVYVGVTRARERLFLSGARRRRVHGGYQDRLPSRFLQEIDPTALDRDGYDGGFGSGSSFGTPRASLGSGRLQWQRSPAQQSGDETYAVNERLRHAKYGDGVVTAVADTPTGQKLTILFDREARERKFLAIYTPLERL